MSLVGRVGSQKNKSGSSTLPRARTAAMAIPKFLTILFINLQGDLVLVVRTIP
jgi:hypothetical protein